MLSYRAEKTRSFVVKFIWSIFSLLATLFMTGCFEHREAPVRLVCATGLEEAVRLQETVQQVDLSGSVLGELPRYLKDFPHLECLILRRATVSDFSVLQDLPGLQRLDLAEMKLDRVPDALLVDSALQHLYLSDNALTNLPPAIASLRKLAYLNLDRNRLVGLPDSLGELSNLRWLRLNHNALQALPDSLGNLEKLQRLYARNNHLQDLPESLARCTQIEDLALSGNQISSFPLLLTRLPKLRNLDLRGNPLTQFPEEIAEMQALRLLTLTECKVPAETQARLRQALPKCLITF